MKSKNLKELEIKEIHPKKFLNQRNYDIGYTHGLKNVETIIKDKIGEVRKEHKETRCNIWRCKHYHIEEKLKSLLGDEK